MQDLNSPAIDAKQPSEPGPEIHQPPSISFPKGGGAIRGIGEKFSANPVTGTASLTVPVYSSPGRAGFGPQLQLSYDSGSGNGPFGFGWSLPPPSITRKTDKGLPRYQDADESDVFILSGAEDLVPVQAREGHPEISPTRIIDGVEYRIQHYRPRIEGLFSRIERWTNLTTGEIHWRSISRDNVTTIYGKDNNSRIFDPADPHPEHPLRIFSWLISQSYDDKGNAIIYEYVSEDSVQIDPSRVCERNRTEQSRSANRYIKRIKYGNKVSRLIEPDLSRMDWLFEVVFDYGEGHYETIPLDDEGRLLVRAYLGERQTWPARQDAFSTYRAGFEIRTCRLCRRVLMFHHFPDELGVEDCLVRSTNFEYEEGPIATFLTSVVQSGYKRREDGTYLAKTLPPLELAYSRAELNAEIREMDQSSLENLPEGLAGTKCRWVDLDGEGINGILTEQAGAWYYKRNLSSLNIIDSEGLSRIAARFAAAECVASVPSLIGGGHQLLDLAGDGQLDLVLLDASSPGFFERNHQGGWESFMPFQSCPNICWQDPNLRLVDLTGDGHADILITEDEVFTWYPSCGEVGFAPPEKAYQAVDEEKGPKLVFSDGTASVYLADISGDGLTDLVRIRNGEVCYWPNLGYGRFGAKVAMRNAPLFDNPDQFDQSRIRLADIDGSGLTDILYLGRNSVSIYLNQSGNSWSDAHLLDIPLIDNHVSVTILDLLGSGTACLVWSSPLPNDAGRSLRYVDLMGGQKPHLLTGTANNLGAETHVHYAPSTKFYLADKLAGRPCITRLPFPVHVVERVEIYDRISRNRFVTRYAYHHGYFDGTEREFRGFGMVEKWDTEEYASLSASGGFPAGDNIDLTSHVPPVLTKTWFHTGAWLENRRIEEYFREEEYYQGDPEALFLKDTIYPAGFSSVMSDEARELCRSLKGQILRQEVYGLDGDPVRERHPYAVSERNYAVRCLQPKGLNRHAVFLAHPLEAVEYHYERNPADPRINHQIVLEADDFGNVLKSVSIAYGRCRPDPDPSLTEADREKQGRSLITYTENSVTNSIDEPDVHRTPLPAESRTYELTGFRPSPGTFFYTGDDFLDSLIEDVRLRFDREIPYEQDAASGRERRLIEHLRTIYRCNDLTGPLPLGEMESLALPYGSFKLAFTPGLLSRIYEDHVSEPVLTAESGYIHGEGDDNWWIPSGRAFFSPGIDDSPSEELAEAERHFFLCRRFLDPYGESAIIDYDRHDLLMVRTSDPLGNIVRAENDYRVLQPYLLTDPNGNRSQLAFDALGMPAGTAIMGKPGENQGDSLADFDADLDGAAVLSGISSGSAGLHAVLQDATARFIYDLFAYHRTKDGIDPQPPTTCTMARETHSADLMPGTQSEIQLSFCYSDGFGREIQKKVQAESGPVQDDGPDLDPRWVGSGWTIFNNKGKPVRQYEPFFSRDHSFEFAAITGVSPVLCYDPAGRVVASLYPGHTWEKAVFNPWRQEKWDVNDTVLLSPQDDPDLSGIFRFIPESEYLPTWHEQRADAPPGDMERTAAEKAALHAETPTLSFFDPLGRPFLTVARNRFERDGVAIEERYAGRINLDIEGNQREIFDSKGRMVMRYHYDMLGNCILQAGMEAGARWMLNNVTGKAIRLWDSRGHEFRTEYDRLGRPVRMYASGTDSGEPDREILFEETVYGEGQPNDTDLNLRTRPFRRFDNAGVVTNEAYDFKGNLVRSSRQLAADYRTSPDWGGSPELDPAAYAAMTAYDGLNRPVSLSLPDGTVIRPVYNRANLLERLEADLGGTGTFALFVNNIDYNAKGQRLLIEYGNGTVTNYSYNPLTARLTRLQTLRGSDQLQDVAYTFDPAGNLLAACDRAQQTIYFDNAVIEPRSDYTYDALYRLIEAGGREHTGQVSQPQNTWNDEYRTNLPHPHDGSAMRRYNERYDYDEVGNILHLVHQAHNGNWTREYEYSEASLTEPDRQSNRLTRTSLSGLFENYAYDGHGNVTSMQHLPEMAWDFMDRLQQADLGGGGRVHYIYDSDGRRVRKVIDRQNGSRHKERIYLSGFEVYREYNGDGTIPVLERETLHLNDGRQQIALIETRNRGEDPSPRQLVRYQIGDYIGSTALELDGYARIISHEEYYPYGGTSYQALGGDIEAPSKRYRYAGMERDEETGLSWHGSRYYAPWVGRWTSPDPGGLVDGFNLYKYCKSNPVGSIDTGGSLTRPSELAQLAEQHRGDISGLHGLIEGQRIQLSIPSDERLSRRLGIPISGWTHRVNGRSIRVGFAQWFSAAEGNRVTVERMLEGLSDIEVAGSVISQLQALEASDPQFDPELVLVTAYEETRGSWIFRTQGMIRGLGGAHDTQDTFHRGGLDNAGMHVTQLRGYLPEGYARSWTAVTPYETNEHANPIQPLTNIRYDQLIAAYGAYIRYVRENIVFGEQGLTESERASLDVDTLRFLTRLAFAAPGAFYEVLGTMRSIQNERGLADLGDVLFYHSQDLLERGGTYRRYVERSLVTVGESSILGTLGLLRSFNPQQREREQQVIDEAVETSLRLAH